MPIQDLLEEGHSKKQVSKIVEYIGGEQKRFNELFKIFTSSEYRIVQRAAWPLSFAVMEHPHFITKHYRELFKRLQDASQHVAVKRNIMKIFAAMDTYPLMYHGQLIDQCCQFIEDVNTKVAVQAYSLQVLSKLAQLYPDIIPEVKLIIEERAPQSTPAFKASAKKFLQQVKNITMDDKKKQDRWPY